METLAGITLYEPDIDRLLENIHAVYPQVEKVICVDNGSKNIEEVKRRIAELEKQLCEKIESTQAKHVSEHGSKQEEIKKETCSKIEIIENGENLGIARALNQMFEYAEEKAYDWVLTLDQDSVCPANLMEEYRKYIDQIEHKDLKDVGVISPKLVDRNFEKDILTEKPYDYIDKCITSASLTSVGTWKKVGGFWEYLFIDFVDHDFCAKCQKQRIKIIRVNSVELLHELGNGEHHNFLGRRVTALNHSPFRKYYMVRNWLIYMHEHKDVIDYKKVRNSYRFFYLKTLLFEDEKFEKLKQMLKGRRDGKQFIKKFL